jgi:DNA-binding transcriptional LysR family regulator
MFDWEDLRYFAVFAKHKSLSGAARQLAVDHATVARRIAALEQALGVKLVDRRPRLYLLTADGERIAGMGGRMEEEAHAIGRAAQAGQAGQAGLSGEVAVSAPPGLSNALIAPHMGRLRSDFPGIHLRWSGEIRMVSLPRREADIALRLGRPSDASLVARKMGAISYKLYASPAYLRSRAPKDYEFIGYDAALEDAAHQRWLRANAGDRPVVLHSNDLETQRWAARGSVGVAALPTYMGALDSKLRVVAATEPPVSNDVWLLVHQDLRHVPAVRAVMDFLIECLENARAEGLL